MKEPTEYRKVMDLLDSIIRERDEARAALAELGERFDSYLDTDAVAAQNARQEVKAAVEEWFTNVSLDDLFAVKGWAK